MPLEGFDNVEPKKGRPEKEINLEAFAALARVNCTMEEIAAGLQIGRRTLFEHVERHPELKELMEEGRSSGRASLRRAQFKAALDGQPTMLVWLGKQLLGQTDRQEHTGADGGPIDNVVTYRWGDGSA